MLVSLPSITEDVVSRFIQSQYVGSYPVAKAFSVSPVSLPVIMVKAGKFTEYTPGSGLYEAKLMVAVLTQIDDPGTDPLPIHDGTVAAMYDVMANSTALFTFANGQPNFHLYSLQIASYDQEAAERELKSILEFNIIVQTLAC